MTERKRLTLEHHAALLAYIAAYRHEWGCPPTIREIAAELSIVVSGAYHRVNRLRELGYLESKHRAARAMKLTEQGSILVAEYRIDEGEAV